MKHLNKKLIYITMVFVFVMAFICVAFIKVNAVADDIKNQQAQETQCNKEQNLITKKYKQINDLFLVIDKNDENLGVIWDNATGNEISTPYQFSLPSPFNITTDNRTLIILSDDIQVASFTAESSEESEFTAWDINIEDLKATANFQRKEHPVTTLHLSGKLLDTSLNPLPNTAFTFETAENRKYDVTTDDEGKYTINDIAQGTSGGFSIADETGYKLDKTIENLQVSSDDFNITAYKKYTLTLAVDDSTHGKFVDDSTGKEASSTQQIIETLSDVQIDGKINKLIVSTTQEGITETQKFTPEANTGWVFKALEIEPAETNSIVSSTVKCDLIATAYFEKKEEPVTTLHLWGQVLNTSKESVSNTTITLTTTKPEANTYIVKTNDTGSFTMEDLPQGATGSFTINYDSGYVLEKSIDNLQASDDNFNIEAYHIYKLNLAVSDEDLGHIQISGQEADVKHDIYESQSQVKTNGEDLIVTYKGVDTTYKAVAKDGATFKNWEVVSADTNSSLGDTVTGNLTATANFEKKVDPTPDPDPKPTPTPDPTPTPASDSTTHHDGGSTSSTGTGDNLPFPFVVLGALGACVCAVAVKKKFF